MTPAQVYSLTPAGLTLAQYGFKAVHGPFGIFFSRPGCEIRTCEMEDSGPVLTTDAVSVWQACEIPEIYTSLNEFLDTLR